MPNEQSNAETKLEKLGKRLRAGAAKARPVTKEEMTAVRKGLLKQAIELQQERDREKERDRGR